MPVTLETTMMPPIAALPKFYLRSLRVTGFRAIDDATFNFQPGLNVIIGANNAAKTAVIDALRLLFGLGTYEKREDSIRIRATDVHRGQGATHASRHITFTATFLGRSDSELPAQFYELVCPDNSHQVGEPAVEYLEFQLLYQCDFEFSAIKNRFEYVRSELRGGPALTNPVPHEVLDSIRAIYLAPLRDLLNDRARVGAEIERLILSHTPAERESDLRGIPGQLRETAKKLVTDVTADKHHAAAGANLAAYARPYRIPNEALSFVPLGISDDLLRSMLPMFAHDLHGADGLPLSSNGLGVNQLIYASIVLSRRGDAEADRHIRRFFLIEEPEAHLHPQLQDSFFHALNQITEHQIFVTSHSPTITAKTDLDKILVMRKGPLTSAIAPLHLADVFRDRAADKRYLHKFLDVTRSQLLFSSGAIFVEGVTEALLLQRFSEIMQRSLRDRGIEIVVIDSSFGYDHFRPLFTDTRGPLHRAVFITDSDQDPHDVVADDVIRADINSDLDPGLDIDGATATASGYGTFEFGLLRTAVAGAGHSDMLDLLHKALAAAAPADVGDRDIFVKDFLDAERPALAYQKMKEKRKNTVLQDGDWHGRRHTNAQFLAAKSEFALCLYEALSAVPIDEANRQFIVPKYIRDAITFVTEPLEETGTT